MKEYKCVLCRGIFEGYGNNAEPLKKGKCCDDCNLRVVQERINKKNKNKHKK